MCYEHHSVDCSNNLIVGSKRVSWAIYSALWFKSFKFTSCSTKVKQTYQL